MMVGDKRRDAHRYTVRGFLVAFAVLDVQFELHSAVPDVWSTDVAPVYTKLESCLELVCREGMVCCNIRPLSIQVLENANLVLTALPLLRVTRNSDCPSGVIAQAL